MNRRWIVVGVVIGATGCGLDMNGTEFVNPGAASAAEPPARGMPSALLPDGGAVDTLPPATQASAANDSDAGPSAPPPAADAGSSPSPAPDAASPSTACAATCGGCCDAAGNCHPGQNDTTCGSAGATCSDCTAYGAACNANGFCSIVGLDAAPPPQTDSQSACIASNMGTCSQQAIVCGLNDTETLECAITSTACTCWADSGPSARHVRTSTLSNGLCQCPTTSDPVW